MFRFAIAGNFGCQSYQLTQIGSLANQHVLPHFQGYVEKLPGNIVFNLLAVGDGFPEWGNGFEFQFQIATKHFFRIFTDHDFAEVLQIGQPFKKKNALDQLIGMFHFVDGFVIFFFVEFAKAPIFVHPGMEEVLIDRCQLVGKGFIKEFDNFRVTFHGTISAS